MAHTVPPKLFRTEEFGDQTKPPLLIDGYFYAQFGTNNTRDGLTCMNMDGEIMWKTKRDPDFNKGSMILCRRSYPGYRRSKKHCI